ncbi:MAG TPA: hypothetical protein VKO85_09830 [Wenzhouxiangellaceae bacterium]|nr:hypothetical protein [Wenzhouxiangellaceae bacterium]
MNRRKFAFTIAATSAATLLGPTGLQAAVSLPKPLPGWSSARAAALLSGAHYRVAGADESTLELLAVETYRADDNQYFLSFRTWGSALPEGAYRLYGPAGPVELYLQARGGVERTMEAVVCHAQG